MAEVSLETAGDRAQVMKETGTTYNEGLQDIATELKDDQTQNNLGLLLEKQNDMTELETQYQTKKGTVNKATKVANEEGKAVASKGQ